MPTGPEPRDSVALHDGLERFAWWLDSAFVVPGTRIRIGFDALIGLIPGLGDLAGTLLSSYIIAVAVRRRVPPAALARMAINVGVEAVVGAVPILGDLFDVVWRANDRNVRLLRQYRAAPQVARRQSRAVVAAWLVVLITGLVGVSALVFVIVRWVVVELRAAV
jgi:hypothetical protein